MPKPHPDKTKIHTSPDGRWAVFYASGQSGHVVRADSDGGVLKRGWYRQDNASRMLFGPFSCINKARSLPRQNSQPATNSGSN